MPKLTPEQLEELKKIDSPTISNAIELFNVRPRSEGFMLSNIKCILPSATPIVGYACTAKISALHPPTPEQRALSIKYYEMIKNHPGCITVIQDVDPQPIGSYWGEVQASIHKALKCVGLITNGGVRDLDAVERIGFGYFASCVLVSHAYVHLVDYDCPVEVGGITVKPGDLIHADKHGVVIIPNEIAHKVVEACRLVEYAEAAVIEECKKRFDTGVEIEELKQWFAEMGKRFNAASDSLK